MKNITVKRWKADQIDTEAKRFNIFCDVVYVNGFYADVENDTVTYKNVEIIKETEKAINVKLSSGEIDGSTKGWKTWIPKSAIVK